MDGALDLDLAGLVEGHALDLAVAERAGVEALRGRKREDVVGEIVFVGELDDVTRLDTEFLDAEGLVLLRDHVFGGHDGRRRCRGKQEGQEAGTSGFHASSLGLIGRG